MAAGMSVAILTVGLAVSHRAISYPQHREAIEKAAGWLLIAGFGLLGYLIESFFGAVIP
jgi:hypothetical protein